MSEVSKPVLCLLLTINAFLIVLCLYLSCVKSDICIRALAKVGLVEYKVSNSRHLIERRCLKGWANSLEKMNLSVDAVFYGNSITYESNFQEFFPDLSICNLGCNRDDLDDLIHRSFLLRSVRPHKIFVLGGINGLINISMEEFRLEYEALVDTIVKQNPDADVYLQSLLPVNTEMELGVRYVNCIDKIKDANRVISEIACEKKVYYVDLYSVYQSNDSLPQLYTRDGLHLKPDAYSLWANAIEQYLK